MRSASFYRTANTYTCIFCEHGSAHQRRFLQRFSTKGLTPLTLHQSRQSLENPVLGSTRWLSRTSALPSPEQTQPTRPEQSEASDFPLSFSFRPKEVVTSQTSQIRQSLRAWSRQNERIKEEEAPTSLPYTGKISQIPNSLFIGDHQMLEDNEEDPRDKEDLLSDEEEQDCESSTQAYHYGQLMMPGTLMSHRGLITRRQDVIYLGDIGQQSLMLLANGKWAAERINQKRVAISTFRHVTIPDFLNTDEVEALRAHMPKQDITRALEEGAVPLPIDVVGPVPDDVVNPILRKMRDFKNAEQRFKRDNKAKLEQMYDKLAYETDWRIIPVKELPMLVLGVEYEDMPGFARKAFVHHANTFHPMFIGSQTAATVTYYLGPKKLHEDAKSVQGWARLYQEAAAQAALGKNVSELLKDNPLSTFIDKARRIIVKSRKIRTPTSMGVLGSVNGRKTGEQPEKIFHDEILTNDDKKIIAFLWDVTMRRPISRYPISHAALIVRAVGAYPNMELNPSTFRMLLQELGVVDPWGRSIDLNMPSKNTDVSQELDQFLHEANASIAPLIRGGTTNLPDSMASIRKDWGSTEAISIDPGSTINIEDAISVEHACELEGGYWIHVHVAHPTSHFSADHPISKLARKYGIANYAVSETRKSYKMVPSEVINQFTLQPDRPVLTISTLLSTDGHVHDVKVTPGIIRNIVYLERTIVDKLMNTGKDVEEAVMVVGKIPKDFIVGYDLNVNEPNKINSKIEYTMSFLPKLNVLQELLITRINRRKYEVGTPFAAKKTRFALKTKAKLLEELKLGRELESYHWNGDPGIIVRGHRRVDVSYKLEEKGEIDVVGHTMRLAAESLGKWLHDRNIRAVYLGNVIQAGLSVEDRLAHPEAIKPIYLRTSTPKPLLSYDMKQYAGCTSPLRKYIDMINHFQVDSYLKAVATGQLQADAPVHDDSILAFSKADIEQYLERDASAIDTVDGFERDTKIFWGLQALFRAFHFKEAALPEKMEMIVISPARLNASGTLVLASGALVPWSFSVVLEPSPEGYERRAKVYEYLPVKLLKVDPALRIVSARAIGPPTAQQQYLEPIICHTPDNFMKATRD